MSVWKYGNEKPEDDRKIEFILKGTTVPQIGTFQNGVIVTPDYDIRWAGIRYWRYL